MSLDLERMDLSAVEALATIKAEQDQLEARLKTMAARREQVSGEVFQRVHGDYRKRLDELSAEAAPLKVRAGDTYRALKVELGGFESAFEAARLDREEIEFRCSLGEFDDAELQLRSQAVDERISAHGKARELALSLRERFLSVVAAESELENADDDTARMSVLGSPHSGARPIQAVSATIVAVPIKGPPEPPEASHTVVSAPIPPPPAPLAPVVAPPAAVVPIIPVAAVQPARQAAMRSSRNPDATVVFRQGRLEPRNAEAGSVVQTLGLKPVSIGSDGVCDLQLGVQGVAKRHCEISMTRAGFSVRDHAGASTTKVNGETVQERVLSDGDTLSIGPAQFNFRLL